MSIICTHASCVVAKLQAVFAGRDGYLRVNYQKLGLTFQTYEVWLRSRARTPASPFGRHGESGLGGLEGWR